jgi:DNA integrity scanning protein DisA with diadenylate cyclase activity
MSKQSNAAARALYATKKADAEEKQRQAAELLKAVKQREEKDIGTFDL